MMHRYALLALVPAVLGCTNPDTDPCASFMSAQPATASPFCATYTQAVATATAGLPAWATACSNKPSQISKECSCYFTGTGGATTTSKSQTTKTTKTATTTLSTRTTTGTGPTGTSPGSCGSPDYNLYGYGAGTTGGGSASPVTVTSCSALEAAVANGGVIQISGMLSGCDIIDLGSDTTVVGVGANSGMTGGGFRIKEASNVIIRNLVFHDAPESEDQIQLNYATYVWIDHCDFSSEGITGDKDYYDGLVDISHASDFVTLSWNKFHDHWKADLIGHSDSNGDEDTGHLRVTEHHNYWNNVNSRTPSLRFGTGHIYSSCFENIPTSGIDSREGAKVLVEQNYFYNVKYAIATDIEGDVPGYATDRNNVFEDSTTEITQTGSVTPPYSYVLDEASCICDFVSEYAGTGVVTGL